MEFVVDLLAFCSGIIEREGIAIFIVFLLVGIPLIVYPIVLIFGGILAALGIHLAGIAVIYGKVFCKSPSSDDWN